MHAMLEEMHACLDHLQIAVETASANRRPPAVRWSISSGVADYSGLLDLPQLSRDGLRNLRRP